MLNCRQKSGRVTDGLFSVAVIAIKLEDVNYVVWYRVDSVVRSDRAGVVG